MASLLRTFNRLQVSVCSITSFNCVSFAIPNYQKFCNLWLQDPELLLLIILIEIASFKA